MIPFILQLDTLKGDTVDTLVRKDTFLLSPAQAALRSAIIPGWGQFYTGNAAKGMCLGLLTLAATSYTLYRYYVMREEESYSYSATTDFLAALILNIAVWGYTIADAFTDAYLYGFETFRDTLKADLTPKKGD